MSLVPGASGQKSVFPDGVQVDHLSENTVGHGVRVRGISNGDTPIAGDVGELIEDVTTQLTPPSLTSTVYSAVASISLPAGRWLVWANGVYSVGGSTTASDFAWVLSVGGVDGSVYGRELSGDQNPITTGKNRAASQLQKVVNVSSTTAVAFKMKCVFTGTVSAYGYIAATRIA